MQVAEAKLSRIDAGPERRGRMAAQAARLGVLSGDLELADTASQQALHYYAETDSEAGLLYAEALSERAKVVEQLGAPDDTARAYDASVSALIRHLGPDHPEVGGELLNRGLFRFYSGDSSGARRDFDAALPALEDGGASDLVLRLVVAQTQLETMSGPVDAAQVRRIQSLYEDLPSDHPEKVATGGLLGSLYLRLDEPERALALFSRILEASRADAGLPRPTFAIDQSNVGECLLALGRLEEAERNFRAARSVLESELPSDDLRLAYPLGGLGRVLVRQGRLELARPHLERALELALDNPGDQLNLAYVRGSLALALEPSPRRNELLRLAKDAFRDLGVSTDTNEHQTQEPEDE
ncbi:MAG: tetratricopeptide repeat protein [Nannocystaceae bacterium]|nr:tetratricopeptide repeat protein [bacterium]